MEDTNKFKELPKDSRWQDLIPKLICPQCLMYHASHINHLERHVILHCKCRPVLLKHHYIKELKNLSVTTNEDIMGLVKLTLDTKLIQWKNDEMPQIPFLLRHTGSQSDVGQSFLLDLWRLWHQEADNMSLVITPSDILHLLSEANTMEWEPDPNESTLQQNLSDDHMNVELMDKVSNHLQKSFKNTFDASRQDFDMEDILRLQQEISLL